MAAKKVGPAEEEYIANHRADMSVREIAEALSLSKSTVQRVSRKLGALAEPETSALQRSQAVKVAECDELVLLKVLAEHLWGRVLEAPHKEAARIAGEYRATLGRITELEGTAPSPEKEEGDLFDAACSGIS